MWTQNPWVWIRNSQILIRNSWIWTHNSWIWTRNTQLITRVLLFSVLLSFTYEFQSESTLYSLPEFQETPCSKKTPYLKFKWQQRDSTYLELSKEFVEIQTNCRVWIHSKTRMWHDNNIQSNSPYRYVLTTQFSHFASSAKSFRVRLWTKWLWVRILLLSLIEVLHSFSYVFTITFLTLPAACRSILLKSEVSNIVWDEVRTRDTH